MYMLVDAVVVVFGLMVRVLPQKRQLARRRRWWCWELVCEDEVNKGKVVDGQPSESGWCEMLGVHF